MRVSDYNIVVPLPDSDEYILIHGYSGAVDVVQQGVVDFLQGFGNGRGTGGVPEGMIETLKKRGYLTERTPEEEQDFVRKLGQLLHNVQKKRAGFLMMPTYDCNLRCSYCYEKRLCKKGCEWLEKVMDRATVDAAYNAMEKIQQDIGDDKASTITLYGGEPFLKRNADIVRYIVAQGGERGYGFRAVTNGVELDEFLDLLGEGVGKVNLMQITLDGPAQVHDKRRFKADGKGSFADIARNISAALEHRVTVVVRTNVDKKNVAGIPELADIYVEQGWVDRPNFSAYCSAVHLRPGSPGQESLFFDGQLTDLVNESAKWHPQVKLITSDKHLKAKFKGLLMDKTYPHFSPVSCGSQLGMYLFDPHGNIYICWDSVGEPIGLVGHYLPDLAFDQEALGLWHERTIMSIPECVACKYALLCGGGCAQHAYYATGNMKSPVCSGFSNLFHQAVPVAYAEYLSEQAGLELDSERAI